MIKEIKYYILEHVENRRYIMKLAISSAKTDTAKTTLGIYWNLVKDAVFFIAYSFFMTVVRPGTSEIEGMPRLVYLFTGLVAWYMVNDNLTSGVKCITQNKHIFSKIKFPILIIPTYETIALYIKRIMTLSLLVILLTIITLTTDYRVNINIFGLIYSIVASFVFGVTYNLLVSGFYTISKDFRELYQALVRIQFYFVPIFWSTYTDLETLNLPGFMINIIRNSPFIHLINSFRRSISLGEFPQLQSVLVFMTIILVMFTLGCFIQYRLRKIYADFV